MVATGPSIHVYGDDMRQQVTIIEGPLEKRGQAVLGRWEPQWFRLTNVSLEFFDLEDIVRTEPRGVLSLDKVSDVGLEEGPGGVGGSILSFKAAGRRVRLRALASDGSIEQWQVQLSRALAGEVQLEPDPGAVWSKLDSPQARSGGTSTYSGSESPRHETGISRIEELYLEHQRRADKLNTKRMQFAEDEMKLIWAAAEAAKAPTKRPRSALSGRMASERLYLDQRIALDKLEYKRRLKEESELRDLEEGRRRARPTRSFELAGPDEACNRLYSDSFRRAHDLQAKMRLKLEQEAQEIAENLAALRNGAPASNRSGERGETKERWLELYELAQEKKVRIDRKREEMQKLERDRLAATRVPRPTEQEERRVLDAKRINELHEEHLERQQRKREAAEKRRLEEAIQLEKEVAASAVKNRMAAATTPRQRKVPLWEAPERRQRPSVRDAQQMPTAISAGARVDALEKGERAKSHPPEVPNAGSALLACIETAVTQRCFQTSGPEINKSQRKSLVVALKAALNQYKDATNFQERDSGYATLTVRPSQRLVGSHLLCDPDRYARRVEPDSIRQVECDLESLVRAAAQAQEQLKACIAPGVDWPSGTLRPTPSGVPPALFALDPGCTSPAAAQLKAQVRYGPADGSQCCRHLLDVCRLHLVFASCDLIQAGIEHLIQYFEVVRVKNYYATPTRMGARFVEVHVVIHVDDDGVRMPHICELRLEHIYFHKARSNIQDAMEVFYNGLREAYRPHISTTDLEKVMEVSRLTLTSPPETQRLRSFRCHVARRFGSTVSAWRGVLGGHRLLQFRKLQELCHALKIPELTVELWEGLDAGCGGCISLWDFDPEACSTLLTFQARTLSRTGMSGEEQDAELLLQKLTYHVALEKTGRIEGHQFQRICKPLGYSSWDADRLFAVLDQYGGAQHPAALLTSDILWMLRLGTLVDIDCIMLQAFRTSTQSIRPRSRGPGQARSVPSPGTRQFQPSTSSFTGSGRFGWGFSPTFDAGHSLSMASSTRSCSPFHSGPPPDQEDQNDEDDAGLNEWPCRSRVPPGEDQGQGVGPLSPERDDDEARRNLDMSAVTSDRDDLPRDVLLDTKALDEVSLGPPEEGGERLDDMLKGLEGLDAEMDELEAAGDDAEGSELEAY